jgi:capsular polysaccharide biosynthesis protein
MGQVLEDVFVNHEALIFRRGRIYPESFVTGSRHAAHYDRVSRYGWFLLKNYWLRRGAVNVPSGLWVIDNYSPDNYHHWMIDCLPRLLAAEEHHPDERVLFLPRYYRRQPYIPFTLEIFPRIQEINWIGARTKTRVRQLAFVPRQGGDELTSRLVEVARRVRGISGEPGTARRLYFSRADALRRRARNEGELVRVLRSFDFEIMQVDREKPWEQVRASAGANLIVGVHGAALTNLMFMQPGGRLLELRHDRADMFFDAYSPMAEALGIEYSTQLCEIADEASGFETKETDLIVDPDLLRENLTRLTAEVPE